MSGDGRLSPTFSASTDGPGLRIVDPIERRRYVLRTRTPVQPEAVSSEEVSYPVGAAVRVATAGIRLDEFVATFVHDATGGPPVEVLPGSERAFGEGLYHVELNAPIKLYLRLPGEFTVEASPTAIDLRFGEAPSVIVGARSYHERPAATITVPDRPRDVMAAVSAFGSALKTTSPERAYPTLRGHPPAIECGSELDIPDGLAAPKTGIHLELPPDYEHVYVASPLAYYLGAAVRDGDRPRIVTETGFSYPLGGEGRGFAATVERVLKGTFLLDCLVRTEGCYPIDLAERSRLEPVLDLDFRDLYRAPPGRRLERYLAVPYDALAEHVPRWALTAHVSPTAAGMEALPYVVDELAVVRSGPARPISASAVRDRVLDGFFGQAADDAAGAGAARSAGSAERPPLVAVERTGSVDESWFGDDVPIGATMGMSEAYRNGLEPRTVEGEVEVAVVCTDDGMSHEGALATDVYGSRADLPFDVSLHEDPDCAGLRRLLAADVDFLHFVGHISDDGFDCRDGRLDAADVVGRGPDVFLLNGCESYRQGRRMVESGSLGGVVTIGDVLDPGAAAVGLTMARLLTLGFTLRTALTIASRQSVVGEQYIVVGQGRADLASTRRGAPLVCDVSAAGDGRFTLSIRTSLPREAGMGATVSPTLEGRDEHYLAPCWIDAEVTGAELRDFLDCHPFPVRTDDVLVWEDRYDAVRERVQGPQ